MPDTLEKLGQSLIQHGKDSDRIYLMKLAPADTDTIIERLEALARKHQYSKIFCKVPVDRAALFQTAGYQQEALIPNFYQGTRDVAFMSRFSQAERGRLTDEQQTHIDEVLTIARQKADQNTPSHPQREVIRPLVELDAPALARLYRRVFPSYPFPITDPQYLCDTMASHVLYFGAWRGKELIAASSAETDIESSNAEMTDFATLPAQRGRGLAGCLLTRMDEDLNAVGIHTRYTIARAVSVGMNVTFARAGYQFAGTLINNTQISGNIESMNVWARHI